MITSTIRDFHFTSPITLGYPTNWTRVELTIRGIEPDARCDGQGLIVGAYNWNAFYVRKISIGGLEMLSADAEVDGMIYSTIPNLTQRVTNGTIIAFEFRYTGMVPRDRLGGCLAMFTSIYRTVVLTNSSDDDIFGNARV